MSTLRVTMPDGSIWSIPTAVINEDRNGYYRTREADYEDEEAEEYDLIDWARNNMNWSDVAESASMIEEPAPCDFDEGWANGDMEVSA